MCSLCTVSCGVKCSFEAKSILEGTLFPEILWHHKKKITEKSNKITRAINLKHWIIMVVIQILEERCIIFQKEITEVKNSEHETSCWLGTCWTNLHTVHRPGDDPRKECEECGNARGSNVRYYLTWKHSPLKDYWLLIID
jgi:hypothetical protein